MKLYRKIFSIIMAVIVITNFCILGSFQISAHTETLDISYDGCDYDENDDGLDERWYRLNIPSNGWHYDHNESTITYRFEDIPDESPIWNDVTEETVETIKTAYANSMKKWNNVYFYSFNSDGTITKNKVINIVETTSDEECNISISFVTGGDDIATTFLVDEENPDYSEDGINNHKHYSDFYMTVNINYFYTNAGITAREAFALKERTGAHEMGHVLGLIDIDTYRLCEPVDKNDYETTLPRHHQELLMGYGEEILDRAKNITYKDIAGVAITRGFHTDADHRWINCGGKVISIN